MTVSWCFPCEADKPVLADGRYRIAQALYLHKISYIQAATYILPHLIFHLQAVFGSISVTVPYRELKPGHVVQKANR